MTVLAEKVDHLENVLMQLAYESRKTEISLQRLSDELREFKDEMKDFKDEMKEYKEENRRETKKMNLRWGEISNKLGTLVEDLVAPSIPRISTQFSGAKAYDLMVRRKKIFPEGKMKEWDAILVSENYVFVNSTKSTLRSKDVEEFIADLAVFREFFPEYKENRLIGILASLYIEPGVLTYAEKKGFIVLGIGEEIMEVKNSSDSKPKEW